MDSTWSTWTPSGFHVESTWNPHRPHTQVWVGFLQKKVHADSMWTPQLHVESRRNLWGRAKSLKTCPLLFQLSQHAPTPSTSLCFHFTRSLILKQCLTTASLALIFYKAISSHSGSQGQYKPRPSFSFDFIHSFAIYSPAYCYIYQYTPALMSRVTSTVTLHSDGHVVTLK